MATVLAAYMAGLGIGAAAASRFGHLVRRPIWVYGLLEFGIAASALAVPHMVSLSNRLLVLFVGGQPEPPHSEGFGLTIFYVVTAFLILIVPTGLMGATLPVLIRQAVQTEEQIGERVGLFYALNTAGAVGGVVVAGFILLPEFGLWGTVWIGVGVNVLVFVIAALLAKSAPVLAGQSLKRGGGGHAIPKFRWGSSVAWIQPLMLISGSITFLYEILWTRLLSHVLGGSIYAFATMLASFLTGITLGSFFAARFARDRERAITYFVICQILIAMTSIGIYFLVGRLQTGTIEALRGAVISMNYLLPATLFIGATFPLARRCRNLRKTVRKPWLRSERKLYIH